MKLFTVQDIIVGRTLETGTWRASFEKSNEIASATEAGERKILVESYKWIHDKARKIIGEPVEVGQALVWASDFSKIAGYKSVRHVGQKLCKIELNIPDDLVLRIPYDSWSVAAISGGLAWKSDWLDDEFEKRMAEYEAYLDGKFGNHRSVEAIIQSLEDHLLSYDRPEEVYQYLFWEIRPEWVTDIEYFTAANLF